MKLHKYHVTVSFDLDLSYIEQDKYALRDGWGYGRYPVNGLTTEQVKEELRTCLSREFAKDECGLSSLPEDFILTVEEAKMNTMLTKDQFELAYRRFQDDLESDGDQFDITVAWRYYQQDGTKYAFLLPFLEGNEKWEEWQDYAP